MAMALNDNNANVAFFAQECNANSEDLRHVFSKCTLSNAVCLCRGDLGCSPLVRWPMRRFGSAPAPSQLNQGMWSSVPITILWRLCPFGVRNDTTFRIRNEQPSARGVVKSLFDDFVSWSKRFSPYISLTSRETSCTPGSQPPSVPVLEPGARIRD